MNPEMMTLNFEWLTLLCWTMLMLSVIIIAMTMCVHLWASKEHAELFRELNARLQ
jgi:hypothetical protein